LAHQVLAGSDAVLVPSRFEPCGLTQLYGLRYGTVPIVARVGGLSDTVIDANPAALSRGVATGVQFAPVTYEMMRVALERTVALYRDRDVWKKMQSNGMAADVSWSDPARRYIALFRELLPAA
jgi:starch synthase